MIYPVGVENTPAGAKLAEAFRHLTEAFAPHLRLAEAAKPGDRIVVAGLTYRITSVISAGGSVLIEALRVNDTGSVTIRLHDNAPFTTSVPIPADPGQRV